MQGRDHHVGALLAVVPVVVVGADVGDVLLPEHADEPAGQGRLSGRGVADDAEDHWSWHGSPSEANTVDVIHADQAAPLRDTHRYHGFPLGLPRDRGPWPKFVGLPQRGRVADGYRRRWVLLERETELQGVDDRLARVLGGQGAVLVVEGPPGIGKTSILAAVAGRAAECGFDVLRARGTQLERSFSFGVARQLLERRLQGASGAERRTLLVGAAHDAPAALGIGSVEVEADQGLRGLHSLYWLAANIAGRRPLALLVDDAQWADRPSLRWLVYLADRLAGVTLLLAIATRDAEPGAEQDLLDTLVHGDAAAVLRPRPLEAGAIDALVEAGFGRAPDPAFSAACGRATGGNPLLLGELVRELSTEGIEPTDANAADVVDFGAEGVVRTVRRRLVSLRPEATRVAECVAVIGDGEPIALVAHIAGLEPAVVRQVAVDLIATDVFTSASRPGFAHPLVRAAVYRGIALPLRVDLHDRAARAIAADGAAAERTAVHLMHTDEAGDGWVARTLLDAAEDAARRGAPDIAAAFAERALREPPPTTAGLADVLRVLGTAEATLLAGDFEEHLRAAMAQTADPTTAGECALTLARAQSRTWDLTGALAVLGPALTAAPAGSDIAIRLEAELLGLALTAVPMREQVAALLERRLEQFAAGQTLDPRLLGPLSGLLIDRPPARRATGVARTAATSAVVKADSESLVSQHAFLALIAGGAYQEAAALGAAMMTDAQRSGASAMVGWRCIGRAEALCRAGSVVEAEGSVVGGLELLDYDQLESEGRVMVAAMSGGALVGRGSFTLAQRLLSGFPEAPGSRSHALEWALVARAELCSAQDRVGDAIADLRAAAAVFEPGEFPNPYQCRWRSPLALALAAVGQREEALELVASELTDARRFEAPVPIGVALSARGVVAGGSTGVEHLREAVAVLSQTEAKLELARARIRLGRVLTGDEGRATLRSGLDLAARCGATPLADEAHRALIAAGGRPRRDRRFITGPESLTAGEFRVARLVADGLSNRQAAQQLYVTQAAVHFHLRNVFRKLDITARTQLPAALAGEPSHPAAKP